MIPSVLRIKSVIARRFIFYIVLVSTLITIFTTAIQLYRDYNNDIALINSELESIETIHLKSLTAALWSSNKKLLQTSIEGILKIRDMQYVEISEGKKIWAKAGTINVRNNIQKQYPMSYYFRSEFVDIGILTVNVSLDGIYQRLLDTVLVILISNAIKTALVALFIFALFNRLVGRHLLTIAEFSEKHDPTEINSPLLLDRTKSKNDEFDIVINSINNMNDRIYKQISEITNQKQHLSQTLNSIGDAVITTDKDGMVTRLNPIAENLTGWSNSEAQHISLKTIFPIVDATTREPIQNPVEKVLETGETVYLSNHTTLISKNGQEHQIADSSAPILDGDEILGMVLVFNDVTEQYRVRKELRESEKKLRLIHSQVSVIVYQLRIDINGKRTFTYVSPAIEGHMGITTETVINDAEKFFELAHQDDYLEMMSSMEKSKDHLSVWEWQGRFIRKDGEVVWLSGTSTPEREETDSILWSGVFVNITERIQSDEIIRRNQKMDALGKLTGGIAHDYNNMLNITIGYADLLKNTIGEEPLSQKYIERIIHTAERGTRLTKKLLSFSKKKSSETKKININTLLRDEQNIIEKSLTARIKLELKLSDDLWPVFLDDNELEDVILNMSINAMHAIKNVGQLIIETKNVQLKENEAIDLNLISGEYISLSFSDSGSGMNQTTMDKIFDPFFTTKGDKGTGLGLSQTYGFVSRSNGAIEVFSELNHGSQFILYFPRYYGKEINIDLDSDQTSTQFKNSGTILIVDDELELVNIADQFLSNNGYKVISAQLANEALDILQSEHVDLLFSDVVMPEMTGFELASIVQEKYPNIKILLTSGYSDNINVSESDKSLFDSLIEKPYRATTVLERIKVMLH